MSTFVNVFRDASGWLVALQGLVLAAVVTWSMVDAARLRRRMQAETDNDVIATLRSWTDDPGVDDEIRQWLKDGELGG